MRESLEIVSGKRFDVAVVGAGINGCSAAQHLAAEGYSTILLDKGDFASGATSRSSRIVHCGLRFMAPDRGIREYFFNPLKLVRRIVEARRFAKGQTELLSTTGERYQPMDVALPIYRDGGYSGWQVDLGARLIGLFNLGGGNSINYRRWTQDDVSDHPFGMAFQYRDMVESVVAITEQRAHWPERIAIDAAMEAEKLGAVIRNFTLVETAEYSDDIGWSLTLRDQLVDVPSVNVSAKMILNLTGVWIDKVNQTMREVGKKPPQLVQGLKGVHALIQLPEKYRGYGVICPSKWTGLLFCLPWGDLHYIGPTHSPYDGNIDDVVAKEDEIEWIVKELSPFFPSIEFRSDNVVMSWAGVRPVTHLPGNPEGRYREFGVLHDLAKHGIPNALALTWGIIANHRTNARKIVKFVKKKIRPTLPNKRLQYNCRDFPATQSPPLQAGQSVTLDDVKYCVESEYAVDLVGVLFRRTGLAWTGKLERLAIERAADVMASVLGWDPSRTSWEVEKFIAYLERFHHFQPREQARKDR